MTIRDRILSWLSLPPRTITRLEGLEGQQDDLLTSISDLHHRVVVEPYSDMRLVALAEDTFRIIVQTNGGIPGKVEDHVGREIVRQCRELYDEVQQPTPRRARRHETTDMGIDEAAGDVADWTGDDGDNQYAHAIEEEDLP